MWHSTSSAIHKGSCRYAWTGSRFLRVRYGDVPMWKSGAEREESPGGSRWGARARGTSICLMILFNCNESWLLREGRCCQDARHETCTPRIGRLG